MNVKIEISGNSTDADVKIDIGDTFVVCNGHVVKSDKFGGYIQKHEESGNLYIDVSMLKHDIKRNSKTVKLQKMPLET